MFEAELHSPKLKWSSVLLLCFYKEHVHFFHWSHLFSETWWKVCGCVSEQCSNASVCVFSFFRLVIVIQLSPAPAPSQRAGIIQSIAPSATAPPLTFLTPSCFILHLLFAILSNSAADDYEGQNGDKSLVLTDKTLFSFSVYSVKNDVVSPSTVWGVYIKVKAVFISWVTRLKARW